MNKDGPFLGPATQGGRSTPPGAAATRPGADKPAYPDYRRRAVLAALVSGLLVLVVGLTVIQLLPTRYVATCTVSLSPRAQLNVDAAAIRLVAQKYAVVAGSTTTVNAATKSTSVSAAELRDSLSVSQPSDTSNLNIKVSLPDRVQAARAANAIGAQVVKTAADDKFVSTSVTGPADAAAAKVQPSRSLLRTIAVAAALLVAGWVAFGTLYFARRSRGLA